MQIRRTSSSRGVRHVSALACAGARRFVTRLRLAYANRGMRCLDPRAPASPTRQTRGLAAGKNKAAEPPARWIFEDMTISFVDRRESPTVRSAWTSQVGDVPGRGVASDHHGPAEGEVRALYERSSRIGTIVFSALVLGGRAGSALQQDRAPAGGRGSGNHGG